MEALIIQRLMSECFFDICLVHWPFVFLIGLFLICKKCLMMVSYVAVFRQDISLRDVYYLLPTKIGANVVIRTLA